jgi:ribosome-associated toxin RatA of RatAB toxin-antitoxin module
MLELDLKYPFSFLFVLLVVITVFSFIPSSYADRVITLQKVSDVPEESLLNTISDVSKYPQIFPDNVKFVKILDNNTRLVEMNAGVNGMFFDTQAICTTNPDGNYVVKVVSGDLKGTTMTTKLEKTWGFHGQKDGGTIANIALNVKTSGVLSWMINFVPDGSLSDALGYGFDKFVRHVQMR